MMKLITFFILFLLFTSCLLDDDGPYAKVEVYNTTLEKINIVSSETDLFGSSRHYGTIPKNDERTVSVPVNRWISATGDVSGDSYGSRIFPSDLTYHWTVTK